MGPRRRRLSPSVLIGAAVLAGAGLVPRAARAQGLTMPFPSAGFAGADNDPTLPSRKTMGRGSVAVFDYEHTYAGTEVEGAPMWWRKSGTDGTHGGWELAIGVTTETRIGHVFLAGIIRTQFRYFDRASFALSPIQNMAMVGIRLGPIEPEARVGMSLLTFDVFHGAYSFEMFSPRVEGGLGLRFGRFRLGAHGFSEYLWRWWGSSYFEKGVAFEVRLEAPKKSPIATE
ncbi:MAG TPA: hypothetical protein VHS09_17235 [Polyangiaceae bacterium]|nr:hypothetical protein [Polyangiaceae bacterium]